MRRRESKGGKREILFTKMVTGLGDGSHAPKAPKGMRHAAKYLSKAGERESMAIARGGGSSSRAFDLKGLEIHDLDTRKRKNRGFQAAQLYGPRQNSARQPECDAEKKENQELTGRLPNQPRMATRGGL